MTTVNLFFETLTPANATHPPHLSQSAHNTPTPGDYLLPQPRYPNTGVCPTWSGYLDPGYQCQRVSDKNWSGRTRDTMSVCLSGFGDAISDSLSSLPS